MQEEVNEKTISLCIKGGKITAQILKAALIKLLAEMDKKKQRGKGEKSQCKKTGRQSIKSLQKSGAQITNIVVTDNNIKSFDRVARKYGIDYSLKKVEQEGKSEYLVFFKAKDVDVMTAAFKEYTSETLKKQKRESVRQKLEKVKEELSNHRQLKKEKKREQDQLFHICCLRHPADFRSQFLAPCRAARLVGRCFARQAGRCFRIFHRIGSCSLFFSFLS